MNETYGEGICSTHLLKLMHQNEVSPWNSFFASALAVLFVVSNGSWKLYLVQFYTKFRLIFNKYEYLSKKSLLFDVLENLSTHIDGNGEQHADVLCFIVFVNCAWYFLSAPRVSWFETKIQLLEILWFHQSSVAIQQ